MDIRKSLLNRGFDPDVMPEVENGNSGFTYTIPEIIEEHYEHEIRPDVIELRETLEKIVSTSKDQNSINIATKALEEIKLK